MEVEANLFVVFQGFNPETTGRMDIEELMRWHELAQARTHKSD